MMYYTDKTRPSRLEVCATVAQTPDLHAGRQAHRAAGRRVLALLAGAALGLTSLAQTTLPPTGTPVLSFAGFFGGDGSDEAFGITRDAAGNVYMVGQIYNASTLAMPWTKRFEAYPYDWGTYVAKFNPTTRTYAYVTFLGGCRGRAIAVDGTGNAYLTGETSQGSQGYFLTTNAYQAAYGGGEYDAFVAKLSSDGTQLVYCTYLGGDTVDLGRRIVVDGNGQAIVMGITDSTNFPTTAGVVQPRSGRWRDTVIAKLGADGTSLVAATYLGGQGNDDGTGLAMDATGNLYVCGRSTSTNFSTVPVLARFGPIGPSAFIAKLTPDLSAITYLTRFGGGGDDYASAVAVDTNGAAYVFGQTSSHDFPTTANALQPAFGPGWGVDNFVLKLSPSGSNLVYATYLGDGGENQLDAMYIYDGYWYLPLADLAVDAAGNAYVAGTTSSANLTHGGPTANTLLGGYDGYVAKVNPSGSALVWLSYVGGAGAPHLAYYDGARALAVDGTGNVFVAGYAIVTPEPPYFPVTPGALQSRYGGGFSDAFLMQLSETAPISANDAFTNRLALSGAERMTVQANNNAAWNEAGEPAHAGNAAAKSLWWTWTAPAPGVLGLTTKGSSFDTVLAVYTNTTLAGLREVASNDDESPDQTTSAVRFPVTSGTAYQIAVDGKNGASGSVLLNLTFSAPTNDDFAHRAVITGFTNVSGSNVDATLEPEEYAYIYAQYGEDSHLAAAGSRSVWWTWTSPVDSVVAVSTEGSSFDTQLAVYTGTALTNLLKVAVNDDETNQVVTSRVSFQATRNVAYQIAVNSKYDDSGTIQLSVSREVPPPEDNFASAGVLTNSFSSVTNYNVNATTEPGEPLLGPALGFNNPPAGKTLWWTWTAPSNGWAIVSTEGSDFDTRLGVFAGTNLTNLTLVASNDNYIYWIPYQSFSYYSRVDFEVAGHTVYYFVVDGGPQNPSGKVVLSLRYWQPPKIVRGSAGWKAGGVFGFQVQGWSRPYQIEVSTNLHDWSVLPGADAMGPTFDVRDTTNPGPAAHRFYRVIEAH